MLSRYILIFLGCISLVWIGYVGVNLIDTNADYNPNCYFGEKDGQVLVINRANEFDLKTSSFKVSKDALKLYVTLSINLKKENIIFLSKLQDQFLIQRKGFWSEDEVIKLFNKANLKIEFLESSKFKVLDFIGEFSNSILHFYKENVGYPSNKSDKWLTFDHKSSASIITFEGPNYKIDDIYYKKNGSIEYVTKINGNKIGKQVDDQDLFNGALPKDIETYHFYEKNYYSNLDGVYKKGPMHYWIESGFVEFEYKGEKVLITDYTDNKDPFLLLNEVAENEANDSEESSTYFKNIRLTKDFPVNIEEGFYIYKMEDFIIVSSSKSICNEVLMSSKKSDSSANSISFYLDELPKKVSERFISENSNYSKSIYKDKIIETIVK